jgi:hypothetical protein
MWPQCGARAKKSHLAAAFENRRQSSGESRLRHAFFDICRLTSPTAEEYISPLGALLLGDGASAKPLTDHSVNSIRLRRMCGTSAALSSPFYGLWGETESLRRSRGCLTSESEERETWTAESLRTVAKGRGLAFGPAARSGRDFGGLRFRSTP